jgi:hypothetical protein
MAKSKSPMKYVNTPPTAAMAALNRLNKLWSPVIGFAPLSLRAAYSRFLG